MRSSEIEVLEREALAMERGEIAPGRVWKVTKRADGTVKREVIHPAQRRGENPAQDRGETSGDREGGGGVNLSYLIAADHRSSFRRACLP